jgi:hypothetical protein
MARKDTLTPKGAKRAEAAGFIALGIPTGRAHPPPSSVSG